MRQIQSTSSWAVKPKHFINRSAELSALKKALLTARLSTVGVIGPGGMGKTSLISVLVREIRPQFDGVLGFETYSLEPNQFEARLDLLRSESAAIHGNKLLIIDNADVVSVNRLSDILRSRFLRETGSQVMVASRVDVPGMDFVLHLGPLLDEDTRKLFEAHGVKLEHSDWPTVLQVTNGHPLTGSLLSNLLASKRFSVEEIARYIRDFDTPGLLDRMGRPIHAGSLADSAIVSAVSFINDDLRLSSTCSG